MKHLGQMFLQFFQTTDCSPGLDYTIDCSSSCTCDQNPGFALSSLANQTMGSLLGIGGAVTIEEAIKLTGHAAWPFVALVALFVLRPYISQVTRAAADLRALIDRSGEVVDLAGQIAALSEATADIKAMQQVAQAARPEPAPTVGQPTADQLWKQLEQQWQQTRDSFRTFAQAAGVSVNFVGTVGVRDAANLLVVR
jgi:hypothetical protein